MGDCIQSPSPSKVKKVEGILEEVQRNDTSGCCQKCVWVYPVFWVISNLETGNPETRVFRGSAQNCLPMDCQQLRV